MKRWVSNVIVIVCVLVFLASGLYLLRYYLSAKQTEGELDELLSLKTEGEADTDNEVIKTPEGKKILKQYKKLYKRNSDLIGWVTVDGTPIDYPVMQTKKDPELYLHCNYKKEYDVNGLPFLDAKCDVEDEQSNLIMYGHHMKSGLMFAHLLDYDSVDFYK